jgi:transposase-like protein
MSDSNNKNKRTYNKYSTDIKEDIIAKLILGRSMFSLSKEFNIPYNTIKNWKDKEKGIDDKIVSLRNQKRAEAIEKNLEIMQLCQDRLKEQLLNKDEKITPRDTAIIYGTIYDKTALALGESTENINAQMQLSDADKKLLDNLAKRQK